LDSFGLLERTKAEFPEMPVVMGSALHDISVILIAVRKGAYDYLLYPFKDERRTA
jgi:response regulator of citrate/malate metabolism